MKKTLWILLDDRRGSAGQAKGIAMALDARMDIEEKQLFYTPFSGIPNWIKGRSLIGVDIKKSSPLNAPYPDIVLSTSRRTVATARWIRKKSKKHTKIVQLMYPSGGVGLKDMELVIVPSHDAEKKQNASNTLVIIGAPTKIFADDLKIHQQTWQPIFQDLPKPWTAVIIGGAIKGNPWPLEEAKKLADRLKQIHQKIGGSLLLTTSRRTGEQAQDLLVQKLKDIPMYTYLWGEKKENPLMGFYACADSIIVTADSVSMCMEACGTGKPVLLFRSSNWLPKKHQRFAESIISQGFAADVADESALEFKPKTTLNPAVEIAEKLLEIS